jgi:hypothetical protein
MPGIIEYDTNGNVIRVIRPATPEEVNVDTILGRIADALSANRAYRAAPIPGTTAARLNALEQQLRALTQQVQGLLRMAAGRLDDGAD